MTAPLHNIDVLIYTESTEPGGVTRVISMTLRHASRYGSVVLICKNREALKPWYNELWEDDVIIRTVALRGVLDITNWFDIPNIVRTIRLARKAKLLHCHLHAPFSCSPIIILAGIFSRTKIVVTEHYITQLKFLRRRKLSLIPSFVREAKIALQTTLKKISFRFIDKIIMVSESNQRFMAETFGKDIEHKTMVIVNGIETSLYCDNQTFSINHGIDRNINVYTVVVVAGLNNQKGHEYLFRSVPIILRKIPETRFVLVGDGHLREYLEELASSLGITNAITFLGFRSDVADIVRASDLFVLPSIFEGLPLSLIEAMACGKAVVATNVDGTADVVVDGVTGYLVPPRDPEQLAQKIIELLENPELRIRFGKAGREKVQKFFSAERMIQDYERLYEELLENTSNVWT
jgi:glycosyltransferase involved in cell wall biosynthesis